MNWIFGCGSNPGRHAAAAPRLKEWLRIQWMVKDSTGGQRLNGGQGLNGWSISFLEIRKMKIMIHGCSNISLPCLGKADPKLIPEYCQIINTAGK